MLRRAQQTVAGSGPQPSSHGDNPSSAECPEAARSAWGGGRCKLARGAKEERSKTGIASLHHVKLPTMGAPSSTSGRHGLFRTMAARRAVNKAMEGFVGGAAQGSAGCQKSWTAALILQSSGSGTYATNAECAEAARAGTTQSSARRGSKAAAEKHRVGPSRQTVAYQCPGPTVEREEHLDSIVSFAGAGQWWRLFWGLDILTIIWATRDLPEKCRYLLNTRLFLKKKDPTSKQFDFDE